jgi:hypothetical protein
MSKCEHNKRKYICKECGGSQICEHNRIKYRCKECGGGSICEHNTRRTTCKECGGSEICLHNKRKSRCKECNGSQICQHNKDKSYCKECKGSQICEHYKRKHLCKECKGSQICEHNKRKSRCKECNGTKTTINLTTKKFYWSKICQHNKKKSQCRECGGSQICQHNRIKYRCKECGGSEICKHNRRKSQCKECGGSEICKHNKNKRYCRECGGYSLCKFSWCETVGNQKFEGYCRPCFVNNPDNRDKPAIRNYKTKEKDVVDRITQTFPNFTWVHDKKIQDGCSRKRPDLLLDMGSHVIIIEVDENKHNEYNCICEHKRLMELSQDLQHRPIIFIRFNPDSYINQNGESVKSCWKLNKLGILQIMKTKQKEWNDRINTLSDQIQYWIDNPTEKTIEIIELFY